MKRMYVDTPEGQVHYRTEGNGEPLVMLHHVGGSSDLFSEMIPLIGKRYRVLAVDILGYGNSDMPSRTYQVEDYARNIIHFLDTLNIRKASVYGRLFGASLAVEMATAHPGRVDKLILTDCCYVEPEVHKSRQERYRNKNMEIKEDGSHLIEQWKHYHSADSSSRPKGYLEMCQRALVNYLMSGLGLKAEDGHRALWAYYVGEKLPLIKVPTLLLSGVGDLYYRRLEVTKSLIPRCRTKVIDGTFFFSIWEKPREFAEAILKFLDNPGV